MSEKDKNKTVSMVALLLPQENLPRVLELLKARYGERDLADLVLAALFEAVGRQATEGKL